MQCLLSNGELPRGGGRGWQSLGGASRGVKQQPRFPGPPTTCSSAQGHQGTWWPRTALPCPAQGSHPFWLLPAPEPAPGPSGSAAAPLHPPSPGPPAPGAAGIPRVVLGRQAKSCQGLCPSQKPHLRLPPRTITDQLASKTMPRGQQLGRPHSGPSALTELTRPREVWCPAPGHTAYWRRAGRRTQARPHTKG